MSGKTILATATDPMIREFLRSFIEVEFSADVVLDIDAEGAVQLARQRHPNLVLVALHLPALEGLEVARLLKDDPVTRSIPVVALGISGGERDAAEAAPFDAFVSRPFENITRFIREVGEYLRSPPPN